MRHSQLKAFHHVALLGGFSRAAEALRLTQPVLSEQVKALEQAHDVLLFSREHRQVALTPAGERLFALTREYFGVEAQIADYLGTRSAVLRGRLRIIADSAHHITDILAAFRLRHPLVAVSVRSGNTEAVLEALRGFEADIGVAGSLQPGRDMDIVSLGASEIVAVVAVGLLPVGKHRLDLRELADWPLVFREEGSRTRTMVIEAAARLGVTLSPAIEAEGREAMREVVASGAGIGFVSRAELGHDGRLRAVPISGAELVMSETLACLARRSEVRLIRSFMELARTMRREPA
ncbi:MAG: LysR family transcriptional regulator [Alphaproteobacteria bacterium]|nr:MAG: LysR family transcriptional regulator [Alphaproteobacteria bacterium]